MDRLHALRDTGSLPRALAPPPLHPAGGGMERRLNDSGLDLRMDDSLTDMQWLQKMDAGSEIPGFSQKPARKRMPKSDKENQSRPKPTKDGGCRKRLNYDSPTVREGGRDGEKALTNKPPLSYASLIVLAISSTPQQMLTLSGIYRWIESTFPFYRSPESKAWKNSIRHNLSIRKNMFTKVYQYPPRRGNGSYWSLLSDGEEELTKARPLFTTLLPPVIDPDSVYCRTPLTHTVKSRGQFVPVLPDMTNHRKTPFFVLPETRLCNRDNERPPLVMHPSSPSEGVEVATVTKKRKRARGNGVSSLSATPANHLTEHSYSKTVTFEPELQRVEEELAPEDLVEGSFIPHSTAGMEPGQCNLQVGVCDSTTDVVSPRRCATPTNPDHAHFDPAHDSVADCSLTSLFGSSFLTPTKMAAMTDLALDSISFSPLYNFVTPQRGGTSPPPAMTSSNSGNPAHIFTPDATHRRDDCLTTPTPSVAASSNAAIETSTPTGAGPIPVPVSDCETTPSHSHSNAGTGVSELDSGVFSPFSDSLRFSTPLGLKTVSPLVDLPGNVFSTPRSSEQTMSPHNLAADDDDDDVIVATPTRKPGSRQLFPFLGSTSPS